MREGHGMRICIPTINAGGQLSQVCDHFGSAPYFTIYDYQTGAYETLNNSGHEHEHGTCHPIENLKGKGIDCIVCKGLGRRALNKLNSNGVKVFRIERSTVKEIVEDFSASKSEEMNADDACRTHRCR
jgi:predicted Fe-Mo cluster-binding NifX family protein